MKKTVYLILLLMVAGLATGCHSNEKNYREAYERAIEHRRSGYGAEAYAQIEAERRKFTTVIDGDSVRLRYVNANVAIDSTDVAHDFNIIVASFTQQINAKSYRDRLRKECGLTGSYVLYGGEDKQYFVVAGGFDDRSAAAAFLRDIDNKVCLKILEPLPWILRKL